MDFYKNIGWQIKQLRQRNGLTLEEMGRLVDISLYMMHRYENGTRKINLHTYLKVCRVFDIPFNFLLGRAEG